MGHLSSSSVTSKVYPQGEEFSMANLELALLLDLVCGASVGRALLPEAVATFEGGQGGPETIVLRGPHLHHLRELCKTGDERVTEAVSHLLSRARAIPRARPESVRDKPLQSVGQPGDYVSLAKYWWPTTTETGDVRFERRDGHVNPDCFGEAYDFSRFSRMTNDSFVLALSSYLTGDDDLGRAAAAKITTWFLDEETAQTPHFAFAQIVPGKSTPTGRGLIEVRYLVQVVEGIRILADTGHLDEREHAALVTWFSRLLTWMLDSENGRRAAGNDNNIAVWYWASCYVLSKFVDDDLRAQEILASEASLVLRQVDDDGSLPAEARRERPHDYTAFSLLGLSLIEAAADTGGIQPLTTETEAGKALTMARDWLRATEEATTAKGALEALTGSPPVDPMCPHLNEAIVLARVLENTRSAWAKDRERLQVAINERTEALAKHGRAVLERDNAMAECAEALRARDEAAAELEQANIARAEALKSRDKAAAKFEQAVATKDKVQRSMAGIAEAGCTPRRVARLERQRKLLALPYMVLLAPITIPLLLIRDRKRKRRLASGDRPPAPVSPAASASPVLPASSGKRSLIANPKVLTSFSLAAAAPAARVDPSTFYGASPVDDLPNTYLLYRIIGNDLVPRHAPGQSRTNVEFILDHEAELENCEKRWIVNRIVDPEEESRIIALLEQRGQRFKVIPFIRDEYAGTPWDFGAFGQPSFFDDESFRKLDPLQRVRAITAAYRLKNLYVMNNNGARNAALDDGRGAAKWILPFDGNCFLTPRGWSDLTRAVESEAQRRYFAVPMQRVTDNAELLRDDFAPDPQEEPQLLFRTDAEERFNPAFPYGRRPKVEMFWRLGLPGAWDKWRDDPWEIVRRGPGRESGLAGVAGWVARLDSGMNKLEQQRDKTSFKNRGLVRAAAILSTIDAIDAREAGGVGFPCLYSTGFIEAAKHAVHEGNSSPVARICKDLISFAEAAVEEGDFSVLDKTTVAPSGNPNDYWHPAPYWWPNPKTRDGLPYVRRDGQRVPGTRMYEPESDQYDRTRLQKMFDNTTICALGAAVTGRQDLAAHGARLVRRWFLDPVSRMNPNLNYAQVRMGRDANKGAPTGVIEFKDIYYFLDAVRLLDQLGALERSEVQAFSAWLQEYQSWLEGSAQGGAECESGNNHGTYYELQAISIAAFLDDSDLVRKCYFRALSRLHRQITDAGEQPEELKRTLTQHYVVFNLQGFLNIFRVAQASGRPLLGSETCGKDRLAEALQWILAQDHDQWPFKQIEPFAKDRLYPLIHSALRLDVVTEQDLPEKWRGCDPLLVSPVFNPHEAIHPFWNIG